MPTADEDALRAIRAASTALQERWPEGDSPRSWRGVKLSGGRVQGLDFERSGLEVLAPQIGQLTALTHLGLAGCKQLKELPPQIGQLTALTDLWLSSCEQLKELPPQIGQLTALTHFYLYNCKQLKELPPQIGQLTALTDLDLRGCEQLKELPPQIGQLLALTILWLNDCEQLTLAPGAKEGQQAQATVAAYARLLIVEPRKDAPGELHAFLRANPLWVPAFFKHIVGDVTGEAITAWLGEAIKATPELANLTAPNGRSVTDAAGQARLSRATAKPDEDALRAIRAASTALQERWPEGDSPRSWQGVEWSGDRVQELNLNSSGLEVLAPQIGQLTALTELWLQNCEQLKELPPQIGQLTALTKLDLYECKQLKELPPQIGQLLALTNLYCLEDCEQLTLAPGAEKGQPGQTIVAAYARLLIVEAYKGAPGELHAFLRANPLTVPAFFKAILTDAAHAAWLGEAVTATPELAKLTDPDDIGRRAIDAAHSVCKRAMQAALFLLRRYEVDNGKLLHRSATAAVAAAEDHGNPEARSLPRVALKAMREVDQVRAELEGRAGLDPKYVIAIKAVYADEEAVDAGAWDTLESAAAGLQGVELQRVPGLSRSIQAHLFPSKQEMDRAPADAAPGARRELKRGLTARTLDASSEYKLLIVLELADRNLKHTIDHEHIAGEDWPAIRYVASHLGRALDHVHAEGGIHADLKPLNAVSDGITWKLIDFDVFCKVGKSFGDKIPSSGYCPPEMAKVLLAATNQDTGKVDTSLLEEYVASVAYDLWSFGVVLYHLCFGTPLWKTDINDNISLSDLRKLAAASDAEPLHKVLNSAMFNGERRNASNDLKVASALLRKLLEPNAQKRLAHFESKERSSMQGVLEEPFFQGQDLDAATLDKIVEKQEEMQREQEKQTALLLTIKELSTQNKVELRHTREALMKGIFEATEVHMPTTFIVLNKELPALPTDEEKLQLMKIAEDGSGVTLNGGLVSLRLTEDGPRFEAEGKCKEYIEHLNTGMKWVNRLKDIGSNLAAGKVGDAFETIKKGLGDLVTGETMYLYLVDELTGEPVHADGYPIEITTPSEIVPKLLPVMQVGLRAMSIFNGAAGIARMVGYPVPKVPEALTKGVRESVSILKKKSSVEDFDVVQDVLDNDGEKKMSDSLRGHSLRDFTDFLHANDPGLKAGKSGHFAGLQRVPDPNSGTALWTTLTDPQEIKRALEARTHERAAELRAGNKYIQEQAAGIAPTPSEAANNVETLRAELKAAREEEAKARAEVATARKDAETARREAEAAQRRGT